MSGTNPWWIEDRDMGDEAPCQPLRRECPKCRTRNILRTERGLDPLPGHIKVRARDGAIWCRVCQEAFLPTASAA